MNNEIERAIAARVSVAIDSLESGNIDSALIVLNALKRVLPEPRIENIDAVLAGM